MNRRMLGSLVGVSLLGPGCPAPYAEDPGGACLATGRDPTCRLFGGGGVVATVRWDGGLADGGMLSNGFFDSNTCAQLCSCVSTTNACQLVSDAGLVECRVQCVGGRAPPGLAQISRVDESPGSWLSRMAELEAAAVHAFLHLARELDTHGLPLLASAARSAAGTRCCMRKRPPGSPCAGVGLRSRW